MKLVLFQVVNDRIYGYAVASTGANTVDLSGAH